MKKRLFLLLSAILIVATEAGAQLNKDYFFYVGRKFIIDNRYSDAIETLNVLLKVDSGAYECYFLRGVAKYNLDDLLGAQEDFSLAISKNPVYTLAYQYRAITRTRLGNYDDALADFREAIDLRPDMPGSYYSRGVTYLLSQQFAKAIDDFNEFIKFEPRVADAYINKGTAYLHLKDTAKAYEFYDQAIRTNRLDPQGYNRRGGLYMSQRLDKPALEDFNKAISCDSSYILSYFNRAIVYANTNNPVGAIADLSKVISLDSTVSITYFNRAIIRSEIGDYNNALRDYDKVAQLSPNNVLVFYNRAGLNAQLGFYEEAVRDYTKSIELYPDFANAYLARASLRYILGEIKGSADDKKIAEKKIAEYRSKLTDSTFSIYADTSRQFNKLLSFDSKFSNREFENIESGQKGDITLLPLFRFSLVKDDAKRNKYENDNENIRNFIASTGIKYLALTNMECDLGDDSLLVIDRAAPQDNSFEKGITQYLIRQYTNSINNYTKAIEHDPSNPYLYLNRSTTRSEMTDFISSIDNGYSNIAVDSDPANRLKGNTSRTYSYDDAIADLNKAVKLMPDFAHIYYNRANLHCLSGDMPRALADYTRAIELYPYFAEAYYNRGLVQIYLKDTKKGCLDISKAGELGIKAAYDVLKKYSSNNTDSF